MTIFGWIVIAVLLLTTAAHLLLSWRQARHVVAHANSVPTRFVDRVPLEAHQKAAAYTVAVVRHRRLETVLSPLLLIAWTFAGGLQWLDDAMRGVFQDPVWLGVAVMLVLTVISEALDLPSSLWRTFRIEQRFGFNRTSLRQFIIDQLVGLALGAVIVGLLGAGALWLMTTVGSLWWLAVWGLFSGFVILIGWAFPIWIAPLFNTYTPLQDEALKARIQRLFERCGVTLKGVYVMDGSRRSSHGNAFFAGMGSSRRVVVYDTLLAQLDADEIEAVLAHEIGHLKLGHIPKHTIASVLMGLVAFAVFGWLASQPWFYSDLGVTQPSPHMAILLFVLISPMFGAFLGPLLSIWSRADEYAADRYAASHADGHALIRALIGLFRENAGTLTPDPWYARVYYSHPIATARIAAIAAVAGPEPPPAEPPEDPPSLSDLAPQPG